MSPSDIYHSGKVQHSVHDLVFKTIGITKTSSHLFWFESYQILILMVQISENIYAMFCIWGAKYISY